MYHNWGCKSIYRPLSYPFRSLLDLDPLLELPGVGLEVEVVIVVVVDNDLSRDDLLIEYLDREALSNGFLTVVVVVAAVVDDSSLYGVVDVDVVVEGVVVDSFGLVISSRKMKYNIQRMLHKVNKFLF